MKFPVSDHCNGKTFFNPGVAAEPGLRDLLRWKLHAHPVPWPKRVPFTPPGLPSLPATGAAVTWIGHSTFLIRTATASYLTDPVLRDRIGPFPGLGPRRVMAAAVHWSELPRIDAVLLSHDHYDHCDLPTLRCLTRRSAPRVVAPLGHRAMLGRAAAAVVELDWWQSVDLGDGDSLMLTPARHWCRRRPGDTNVRLWGGFMLRLGGRTIYFLGDSGYDGQLFKEIGRRCGPPDLALIPIGAYEPRWFMRGAHMNPSEAVQVHRDLRTRRSVAMHWGTFQLTDEGREEPVRDLEIARHAAGLAPADFMVLPPGGTAVA